MSLAVDLMGVGLPQEQATRLGYSGTSAPTPLTTAGTAQGTATAIPKGSNNVLLTTASSQTGARLPSDAELTMPYVVTNSTSTTAVVYPPTSGTINSGSANAGVNISQNESATFWRLSANRWVCVSTANPSILGSSNTWTGANQFNGTITVGVDDTGYDVTFFGATTGKSLLWDESADKLIVTGKGSFSDGVQTTQSVANVNDTTPTDAELQTAFGGTAASKGRGFLGTIDDNDGNAIGYIVWTSDASYYFVKGTKAT